MMMSRFKTAQLIKERQTILIKFPLEDNNTLNRILSIPFIVNGYSGWECPINKGNIDNLKRWGFELSDNLLKWDGVESIPKAKMDIPLAHPENILYQYQKDGVGFVQAKNGRALIADEMGLGKTVQALSWLQIEPTKRPVLIICPSSLKLNWQRETQKWVSKANIEIISGTKTRNIPIQKNIVIINYDILPDWWEILITYKFQVIILDEAHYIKNNKAQRTVAFKKLNRKIPHLIALSGTPIENRPIELYNIIQCINKQVFPDYFSFIKRFCAAKMGPFGWETTGASNTQELNQILKNTIMIRRKKEDVLKELPSKILTKLPLEIDNMEEYKKAENSFIEFIKTKYNSDTITKEVEEELKKFAKDNEVEIENELTSGDIQMLKQMKIEKISNAPVLVQIEYLKQLAVKGKLKQIINWVEDFLESDEKLVIFAIHKFVIDALMKAFPTAVKIDGSVSSTQRQVVVDKFQNDKNVKLFIGNMKAAGIGLTLTAASNVVITEYPWSPSILFQAIDRVHRITQKHQVTAWNLVGMGTIEEKIIDLLKQKESIIGQILDGKSLEDKSVLMQLIKSYK